MTYTASCCLWAGAQSSCHQPMRLSPLSKPYLPLVTHLVRGRTTTWTQVSPGSQLCAVGITSYFLSQFSEMTGVQQFSSGFQQFFPSKLRSGNSRYITHHAGSSQEHGYFSLMEICKGCLVSVEWPLAHSVIDSPVKFLLQFTGFYQQR